MSYVTFGGTESTRGGTWRCQGTGIERGTESRGTARELVLKWGRG
jgi:hypothetical protein